MSEDRDSVIEQILEIEVEMFLRVPAEEETSCRTHMSDMKLHRRGQFAGWSNNTCLSYLEDLKKAKDAGRNLMTLKYARMDNLIPPLNDSQRIPKILDRFVDWQKAFIAQYPAIMSRGRDMADFANYLRSELETYSDRTLELLAADVDAAVQEGRNLSMEVYLTLARQSGYATLNDLEMALHGKDSN